MPGSAGARSQPVCFLNEECLHPRSHLVRDAAGSPGPLKVAFRAGGGTLADLAWGQASALQQRMEPVQILYRKGNTLQTGTVCLNEAAKLVAHLAIACGRKDLNRCVFSHEQSGGAAVSSGGADPIGAAPEQGCIGGDGSLKLRREQNAMMQTGNHKERLWSCAARDAKP